MKKTIIKILLLYLIIYLLKNRVIVFQTYLADHSALFYTYFLGPTVYTYVL